MEVIGSRFAGAEFSWLERLPVTQEAAGSSPVAPAILTGVAQIRRGVSTVGSAGQR